MKIKHGIIRYIQILLFVMVFSNILAIPVDAATFEIDNTLPVPEIKNVTYVDGVIQIEWNKVVKDNMYDPVGYLIYESKMLYSDEWDLIGKATSTRIEIKGDYSACDYIGFRVSAVFGSNESKPSEEYWYMIPFDNPSDVKVVDEVEFEQSSYTVKVGDKINVSVVTTPEDVKGVDFQWSTDDEYVASVASSSNGYKSATVTGIKEGHTYVNVSTSDGESAFASVFVIGANSNSNIEVEDVYLSDTELELEEGETWKLEAYISPFDATNQKVTWSSSYPQIATVDSYGKVTALSSGKTEIIVTTANGLTETCYVVVEKKATPTPSDIHVSGVKLSNNELILDKGEKSTLVATITPEDATNKSVTWSSSDKNVVTVNTNGIVTAVGSGYATVTVKTEDGGYTNTCKITVLEEGTSDPEPADTEIRKDSQGRLVYYKDSIAQTNYTGLVNAADEWYYVERGIVAQGKNGYVNYKNGKFLVVKGKLETNANGLVQDVDHKDDWYYCSSGQVQLQYTGLAMYDGEWFYINNGKLDTSLAAYVEYDGGVFYVAAGRILNEVSGLAQDPKGSDWYYLANGQVQNQYTGLAQYDGEWFYVEEGRLAKEYLTMVEYNGGIFCSEYGMIVEEGKLAPTDVVIAYCNNERRRQGIELLQKSDVMCTVAQTRASELTVKYSDKRPNGEKWWTVLKEYGLSAEAVECKARSVDDPKALVESWMDSPNGKEIINQKYERVGVGMTKKEGDSKLYWSLIIY